MEEKKSLWSEILESKFGGCLVREEVSACHSLWWKDLCKIWWCVVGHDMIKYVCYWVGFVVRGMIGCGIGI